MLPAGVLLSLVAAVQLASDPDARPAGDSPPAPDTLVASNATTEKELLLYFEERDLISATKRATPLRTAPAIATVISADEIRNMGARNLLDVLRMVPGFGVSISEWSQRMVEVRGVRTALSEKILFMIDGHSLNRNYTGSAVYDSVEMMPVEDIKRVEVVRGPGSALYGSSAFVATVNVITRDAPDIDGVEAKAGGGSFGTFKGNVVGGKVLAGKLSLSGSLDSYRTDGARLPIVSDVLTGTPYTMTPGTGDLSFNQTYLFLKASHGDLSFRGGWHHLHRGYLVGLGYALTDGNFQDASSYWGELAYALRLGEALSSNLKVSYDRWRQDPNVKILPNGFPGFPEGMVARPLLKDRTIGAELQVDWDVFEGNHLIAGLAYEVLRQYDTRQLTNYDPTAPIPTPIPGGLQVQSANWNRDVLRHSSAAYLQDEWQVLAGVRLTGGARYDRSSDFGDTVNPRAALVWTFLEAADLKLLYGQAFRAPNFVELYDINNPVVLGSPDLKPETIRTWEAGLAWRLHRFLAVDLSYFFSSIDDLIIWDTNVPPGSPALYVNAGRARTQGGELSLNGSFGANLSWRLTYVHQDPRDDITGTRLPDVPSNRATASGNWAPGRWLNLHGDLLWTGPRPRAQGDTRPETKASTTVDVAVTAKDFLGTLAIQLAIHNLFDKRSFDPDTSGAQKKAPNDFPREGLSAFLSASYKL